MANFAYLKCFNDLLLKKMERLQKENKELKEQKEKASRLKRSYNSLVDCVNNCDYEIVQCEKCDDWDHYGHMEQFSDIMYCGDCSQNYVECCWCGNHYNLDDDDDKKLVVFDMDGEVYCKDKEKINDNCWELYEEAMVKYYKKKYDDVIHELIATQIQPFALLMDADDQRSH